MTRRVAAKALRALLTDPTTGKLVSDDQAAAAGIRMALTVAAVIVTIALALGLSQ